MGRERAFSTDEIEHKAMEYFWLHGYEGTSIGPLVAHLGISRSSLYSVYPDKRTLFRAAFRRYTRTIGMEALRPLAEPGAPRERIRRVFETIARQVVHDPHRRGCLMVNTITEMSGKDEELARITAHAMEEVRQLFAGALEPLMENEGRTMDEITADSHMLVGLFLALRVMARTGPSESMAWAVIERGLAGVFS